MTGAWGKTFSMAVIGIMAFHPMPALAEENPVAVAYDFVTLAEAPPAEAWHATFIHEAVATPTGAINAGADALNGFLAACFGERLERTAARTPWRDYAKFLKWAVWGYLSPDSAYRGDERLLVMAREWLDRLSESLRQPPDDPEKLADWAPDRLGSWAFIDYALPMLEIRARPKLVEKLGTERVARFEEVLMANLLRNTTPEVWNGLLARAQPYVNIATHPMAIYLYGWLTTGEEKYWRMAASLVAVLERDQLPNGMFPYRYRIYGDTHCEFEGMYYHAINVRALYMFWWATGSEAASRVLHRSVPYYPLNMEPPYHFNDGPAIWWKNIWRTFWPHHIAMVAAVAGDGENAKIALDMARDRVSHDRIDLFLGAHAYQQLAVREVAEQAVRDRYVVRDPDIRGLRVRFSPWSATFTTGSFTYTRASAMYAHGGRGRFDALHMARPYLRTTPLETKPRYEMDFGTLSRHGADFVAATAPNALAVATRYRLAATAQTWREEQDLAPLTTTELWIMTDRGMVGILDSRAEEAFEAYELNHQFRFITGDREDASPVDQRHWRAGELSFRIWDTDFPAIVEERTRRFAMAASQRIDWQLSLADMERLPEQIAQDGPPPPTEPGEVTADEENAAAIAERELDGLPTEQRLPERHPFPADYRRFSLVEISPANAGFVAVEQLAREPLLVLRAQAEADLWLAVYNPGDEARDWPLDAAEEPVARVASWDEAATGRDPAAIAIPPGGIALFQWQK